MDLPHASPPSSPDLENDFRRLQSLFTWAAGALLLLGLTTNLFIAKQLRLVQLQLAAQRDGVIRQAMEFQKRDEPLIRKFVARLQEFSGKHPDFQAVLEQYRPVLGRYFSAITPGPVSPVVPPRPKQTNR